MKARDIEIKPAKHDLKINAELERKKERAHINGVLNT
jgi:hypothetical protein